MCMHPIIQRGKEERGHTAAVRATVQPLGEILSVCAEVYSAGVLCDT